MPQKPSDPRHPCSRTANTAARPTSTTCHDNYLNRDNQTRKHAKRRPRRQPVITTAAQQPSMFHVKHIYFERSKTLVLRNMPCLRLLLVTRSAGAPTRLPLYRSLSIGTTSPRCNRPANFHQGDSNSLSSLSRAGSMVIRQDIRAHQPHSTPSSIKPRRRLHLNTRASNVSYHFRHTPQPPIFLPTTNTLPQSNRQVHKNAPHAFVGQPRKKTTKTSINIDFLPLFHIKHRLGSGVLPSLSPSALPPSIQLSKDKAYRAVQTRALHSLAIIPRNLHGVAHSIQFRVDLNTLTRSR